MKILRSPVRRSTDTLKKAKVKTEKDRMADEMDLPRARDNVRNAMQNHNDLVALVGIWAYNAHAIVQEVSKAPGYERGLTFRSEPWPTRLWRGVACWH